MHKYAYVHGDPIGYIDPTGQFSLAGTLASFAISMAVSPPDAGQLIQAVAEALVTGYVVNLQWDAEWARNWDLPDSLWSRSDDTWVAETILLAIGYEYEQWFDDVIQTIAPGIQSADAHLRRVGNTTRQRTVGAGRVRAGFSSRIVRLDARGNAYTISTYRHKSMPKGQKINKYPRRAIAKEYRLKKHEQVAPRSKDDLDRARQAEIRNANRAHGKPADYNWEAEYGEPMTWHHDSRKNTLQLIPAKLHEKTKPHYGKALWHHNTRPNWAK